MNKTQTVAANMSSRSAKKRVRSMDGLSFVAPPAYLHPRHMSTQAPTSALSPPSQPSVASFQPSVTEKAQAPRASSQKRVLTRAKSYAQTTLLVLGSILLGFFVQYVLIGQIVLAIYGIWAAVARISSKITFTMALISLGTTFVLLIMRPQDMLVKNFATYSFLLLVVGAITFGLEVRRDNKKRRLFT